MLVLNFSLLGSTVGFCFLFFFFFFFFFPFFSVFSERLSRVAVEPFKLSVGDAASGVHCQTCKQLFPSDRHLFQHQVSAHPQRHEVQFAPSGARLKSNSTALAPDEELPKPASKTNSEPVLNVSSTSAKKKKVRRRRSKDATADDQVQVVRSSKPAKGSQTPELRKSGVKLHHASTSPEPSDDKAPTSPKLSLSELRKSGIKPHPSPEPKRDDKAPPTSPKLSLSELRKSGIKPHPSPEPKRDDKAPSSPKLNLPEIKRESSFKATSPSPKLKRDEKAPPSPKLGGLPEIKREQSFKSGSPSPKLKPAQDDDFDLAALAAEYGLSRAQDV